MYLLSTYYVISTRKNHYLISHLTISCEEYTIIKFTLAIKEKDSWVLKTDSLEELMFKFRVSNSRTWTLPTISE